MSEYVEIVKRAMERNRIAYPHLDIQKDEKTLLNTVYREAWNLAIFIETLREPSFFKNYLNVEGLPEEIHKILREYVNGSMSTEETVEKIKNFVSIIEIGAKKLGYIYDNEIGMFVRELKEKKKSRGFTLFNLFF